jgi:hypothetical protein
MFVSAMAVLLGIIVIAVFVLVLRNARLTAQSDAPAWTPPPEQPPPEDPPPEDPPPGPLPPDYFN